MGDSESRTDRAMPARLRRGSGVIGPIGRVLVTGGAGFIGSHLTRRLLVDGHQVVVVDDFSTGRRANLGELLGHPRLSVIEHDITAAVDQILEELGPDLDAFGQVYHLACPASPVHYQADAVKTITTCTLGSLNMLKLSRRTGATILLSSTSEVYGDPVVHPQPESYWGNVNPIGIRACYDEGKRAAEAMFFSYQRQYGLPIKVARIFNTYGPLMRADDGRVVSNFIVSALTGRPIVVAGDGSQTRSFCYVDDLVEGLILLMNSPADVSGPINLGNPAEFTISELARTVRRLVGDETPMIFGPLPEDDPTRRRPVIDQATELLGWRPDVDLAEGLQTTIAHFRSLGVESLRLSA